MLPYKRVLCYIFLTLFSVTNSNGDNSLTDDGYNRSQQTISDNGKYKFKCQHGPGECYGNKLHACALHIVKNQTEALLYNSCMMDFTQTNRGSDDIAADGCGKSMNINSHPIKSCAKGDMGVRLLKHYGDESKKANFNYVPYILVNGKESDGSNFMKDVCAAFVDPPPPCASV